MMLFRDPIKLEQQRAEFASRRFLATPLAGLIAWTIIGRWPIAAGGLYSCTSSVFATSQTPVLNRVIDRQVRLGTPKI
ncbi:MAG TPA: hypothetical protein VIN61_03940 [Gammaproteobacteria bacterium]